MTKTCTKCRETLPATPEYFYKDNRVASRLQSWCKKCRGEYEKERHRKKQEAKEAEEAREQMIEANTPKVVRFRIGQAVKAGQRYGRVCGIFKYFIVIDFKKYKECFPYRKIS